MAPSSATVRADHAPSLETFSAAETHRKTSKPPKTPNCTLEDKLWPTRVGPGRDSLVRVRHAPSVKNWHGCGWRLLDRKKPATIVERHVSWENQPKWEDLIPQKKTKNKKQKNLVKNSAKKHIRKSLLNPNPVKSFARGHQPPTDLIRGIKNSKALMALGHKKLH